MATDIFTQSNALFLSKLTRPRFRYEQANNRLILFVDCQQMLPPSWLETLRVEVISDDGSSRIALDIEWLETDASLVVAQAPCPEVFRLPRDTDMVPIGTIIFATGQSEVSIENMRSPKAFAAREMNPSPIT